MSSAVRRLLLHSSRLEVGVGGHVKFAEIIAVGLEPVERGKFRKVELTDSVSAYGQLRAVGRVA